MHFLNDLLGYFKKHRKLVFLPVILLLLLAGMFMILASSSAIAPFIYAIF